MPLQAKTFNRYIPLLECMLVFIMLICCIWVLRDGWYRFVTFAVIAVSQICRKGWPKRMGFWPDDFWECFRRYGERVFIGFVGVLVYAGLLGLLFWGSLSVRDASAKQAILNLTMDVMSGLGQQYLLNGFFADRLSAFYGKERLGYAAAIAASLFSFVHAPNLFLMFVTLIGGYVSVRIFFNSRNIYFLALAHGLIKFLLFILVPDRISHGFKVGPRLFFEPR